jgi:uncharacterized protein
MAMRTDRRLWAAFIAAPIYWTVVACRQMPALELHWPWHSPLAFLLIVLVYPVLEEIVFRGLIQEFIQRLLPFPFLGPVSMPNAITSILFAGLHILISTTLAGAWVFFPSLVFGYFKDRYLKLTAPILLHIFYNGGYFMLFHTNY